LPGGGDHADDDCDGASVMAIVIVVITDIVIVMGGCSRQRAFAVCGTGLPKSCCGDRPVI
jgi:hypothetical protein